MFRCVAKCPELDDDGVDGCPVGNSPKFIEEDAAK